MTAEQELELRKKVLALIHTPKLDHYSECAKFVLQHLRSWTVHGNIVKHLNAEYIEIIEGLWDELCKDNPLAESTAALFASPIWNGGGASPCGGCGKKQAS